MLRVVCCVLFCFVYIVLRCSVLFCFVFHVCFMMYFCDVMCVRFWNVLCGVCLMLYCVVRCDCLLCMMSVSLWRDLRFVFLICFVVLCPV